MSLSDNTTKKSNDLLPNYCFFFTQKALQEFPYEGNLYKSFHLMDKPLVYL